MSGYKGHIAGATALCGVYLAVLSVTSAAPYQISGAPIVSEDWIRVAGLFVLAILFGLWPDVDTNSKGQDIFFTATFAIDLLLIYSHNLEAAAYLGLIAMTPIVGRHRGWTHTKLAMILVPLPILLVPYLYNHAHWHAALLYYGAAVIGYFSHLLLDGLIVPWIRFHGTPYR